MFSVCAWWMWPAINEAAVSPFPQVRGSLEILFSQMKFGEELQVQAGYVRAWAHGGSMPVGKSKRCTKPM